MTQEDPRSRWAFQWKILPYSGKGSFWIPATFMPAYVIIVNHEYYIEFPYRKMVQTG